MTAAERKKREPGIGPADRYCDCDEVAAFECKYGAEAASGYCHCRCHPYLRSWYATSRLVESQGDEQ